MFDKLAFWKKEPETTFEKTNLGMHDSPARDFSSKRLLDDDSGSNSFHNSTFDNTPPGIPPKPTFQPQNNQPNFEQNSFYPNQQNNQNNQSSDFPKSNFQMQSSFEKNNFQTNPLPKPQMNPQSNSPSDLQRDVELILSKLDTIKALLDNLTQRVDKLEKKDKYW